jgi:hypothetical protein
MWKDEIVEEIHRIREESAIFADLCKKQEESGREIVILLRKSGLKTRWSGRAKDMGEEA